MAQKRCFGCMQLKENSPVCEHCGFNEFAQNESHQLPLGTVLRNQYLVGKCLGQGGFGITYLGWDLNLDIPIAIKEYYPNSIVNRDTAQSLALTGVATNMMDLYVSTRQRFLREAKVLAMLRNVPNIVQVHNFFEENNTAYIIMEYVKGIDLRRYMNLRGGRLSVDETLAILKPVMQALQRVHDFEIVHRDISPDNIMMMPDGTAKLLDFGAVRNVESADAEQELQHSTEAILKHGFAPMEQYQKRGALGPWTDEYAMCATVYYCLTGRVPPDAPQRMMEDVHPAWEKIPGLSPQQIQVLEKGMSLRAKDRYASVSDLMEALYGPDRTQSPVTSYVPEPVPVTRAVDPIGATKPVEPAAAQSGEAEIPAYTAPMMTAPVEHVELPQEKKKGKGGLIAGLAVVAVLLVAGFVALGILPKPEVHTPPATEAPVITTEAPETTAPVETTEATEPLPVWYDNVLMVQNTDRSRVFGTELARTQIKSITFRDSTAGAPADAWDVSKAQDGSVLMWCENDIYFLKDLIIAADGGINASNTVGMFLQFINLESVDFGNAFHTDYAVDFTEMFLNCENLKALDLSSFQTGNVTHMTSMFEECGKLTYVNMNGWDTSNVTDMWGMFYGCDNMGDLEIKDWDITYITSYDSFLNKVKTINGRPWEEFFMYRDFRFENDEANAGQPWADNILMAQKLGAINFRGQGADSTIPAFGTNIARGSIQSVTFLDSLSGAPAETWDVSAAQDGGVLAWAALDSATGKYDFYIAGEGGVRAGQCVDLFAEFTNLKTVNFGTAFHVEGIKHVGNFGWYDIEEADMTHFNLSSATNLSGLFSGRADITKLDLSGWDVSNVTDMSAMFSGCQNLTELNLSGWDVSNVTYMNSMFSNCRELNALDISGWDTSNVTDMVSMFYHCDSLTEMDLSGWDVSNVTDMASMFRFCDSLTEMDLSAWDVSNVTNMRAMFQYCNSLTSLDLSAWDISRVEWYESFMDDGDTINGQPWEEFFQ